MVMPEIQVQLWYFWISIFPCSNKGVILSFPFTAIEGCHCFNILYWPWHRGRWYICLWWCKKWHISPSGALSCFCHVDTYSQFIRFKFRIILWFTIPLPFPSDNPLFFLYYLFFWRLRFFLDLMWQLLFKTHLIQ